VADRRDLKHARLALALAATLACAAAAHAGDPDENAAHWAVPEEGCRPPGGVRAAPSEEASSAVFLLAPGATLETKQIESVRAFLPEAIWTHRERFFPDGMRVTIGPCFRDYAPPAFFDDATAAFRGRARLTDDGGLADHVAGLPFAPEEIAPDASDAGLRWAWNAQERYRAGGLRGRFRLVALPSQGESVEVVEGDFFWLQLQRRADRAASRHRVADAKGKLWVAGGTLTTPNAPKPFTWRLFRDADTRIDLAREDELHGFLPEWERVRRLDAPGAEGLFVPLHPKDAEASRSGENGFAALELRPQRWTWRVAGLRDQLAPIDLAEPVWPEASARDFGPFGVAIANDRFELRRTLLLEARATGEPGAGGVARRVLAFDLQTLVPLYATDFDARDRLVATTVLASRWSEDRGDYPPWPDDRVRPVRVLDSVAIAHADLLGDRSFRRESWDVIAIPPPDDEIARLTSLSAIAGGR
jgi:hypothetical protein